MRIPWVDRDLYDRLVADHQALQDRVRQYMSQNDYLREALDEARADATRSREMVCDFLAQQVLGRKIFGTAPDLPAEAPAPELIDQIAKRGQGARARALRAEADFLSSYNAQVQALREQSISASKEATA